MPGKPGRWLFAVACALATMPGCGGTSTSTSGARTITAKGVVTFSEEIRGGVVAESAIHHPGRGTRVCDGTGRFSDMTKGESIIIRDAGGRIVGTGQLELGTAAFKDASTGRTVQGVPQGDGTSVVGTISCTMPFRVFEVDPGSRSYTVAIGDRVPLFRVKRAQLKSMVLAPS